MSFFHCGNLGLCYFQKVNAICHVASSTMDSDDDIRVKRLDWSAQSPDLSPIENHWDEFDGRIMISGNRQKMREITYMSSPSLVKKNTIVHRPVTCGRIFTES